MRILAIRGSGLASLAEPFEVDLDGAALRSAGVFAIVGPTGAGKSTLLDAMCLALFGATPRLRAAGTTRIGDGDEGSRTAQDPRGLVRADQDFAHAESDFLGVDGRTYRARWEARRGKKELKIAASLVDLGTSARLGGGRREVLELITARLGLDEAQFRRSVLLAQGELTAFLHAEERDRAQLLERVTGTEIYGRISMEAHLRAAEESARLAALESALLGVRPLDESRRAALEQQEASAREAALAAELALRQAEDELRWQETARVLLNEVRAAEEDVDLARRQLELAEAERSSVEEYRQLSPARALLAHVERLALAEAEAARRTRDELGVARAAERSADELSTRADSDRAALERARASAEPASAGLLGAVAARRLAATEEARAARERARTAENDATRATMDLAAADRELALADDAVRQGDAARTDQGGAPIAVALALRQSLSPGEPCAVCGSRDHPGGPALAPAEPMGERALAAAVAALARAESARATRPLIAAKIAAARERHAIAALALRAATTDLSRAEAEAAASSAALRDAQDARQDAEVALADRKAAERRVADVEAAVGGARVAAAAAGARGEAAEAERRRSKDALDIARSELAAALGAVDEAHARSVLARELSTVRALEAELSSLDERRRTHEAVLDERRRRLDGHERTRPSFGTDDTRAQDASASAVPSPGWTPVGHERARTRANEQAAALETARVLRAALEQTRARDDAQKSERGRRAAELAQQSEAARVWRSLAAVIGSADGKKLRVHAQRLTLQALVESATDELRGLAPRFELEVAPGGTLAIQVVDSELGGEPRSVASLSGGETFVVSLALALALANLASRRVTLGTLFIDEGFGSLDPASLDVVLSTLEALESRGRQIGLVSHVPDVRERFAARVEVRPVGAGRSRVAVVG